MRLFKQPGDVIIRYDGTRIFSGGELRTLTGSGVVGEPVRVEVDRDGVRLEYEIPRGPLGVQIGADRVDPFG